MSQASGRVRANAAGAGGAVLLEALVAIAVVGVALLFLVAVVAHESSLTLRADAHRDATRLLEATVEALRARALPLESADYSTAQLPWLPIPERRGAVLWVDVIPLDIEGLYEVEATVRYEAGRHLLRRSLTTRLWMP